MLGCAGRARITGAWCLKVDVSPHLIGGEVEHGYGKLADAFRANLAAGWEVGAALAVYRRGQGRRPVGGYRDGTTRTPWRPDTMVNLFSTTTKGGGS